MTKTKKKARSASNGRNGAARSHTVKGRNGGRSTAAAGAATAAPDIAQVHELMYQALETELGGVEIYRNAVACAQNDELREEWQEYLEQTERHVEVIRAACEAMGLDPEQDSPGRKVVRHIGESLVKAMKMARSGPPAAAELVAAECVTLAETKDHQNWSLLTKVADVLDGEDQDALLQACEEVEPEEDEHLYHTAGWCRELWLEALGLPAQVPPPEEEQDVESMEEAGRAKKSADKKRRVPARR